MRQNVTTFRVQHNFSSTYQIEFKNLTMTTVIVDNKDTTFLQNTLIVSLKFKFKKWE